VDTSNRCIKVAVGELKMWYVSALTLALCAVGAETSQKIEAMFLHETLGHQPSVVLIHSSMLVSLDFQQQFARYCLATWR
jgi:hypothetical protein